jgi:UMF1 family MFS transporter
MQQQTAQGKQKLTRPERSWILYDWANSVYATIMMAAVFPIYFTSVAGAAGQSGDYWWAIGTSVSMLAVAILAPMVGALSDFLGYRKKLFTVFFALGVGLTLFSAFVDRWELLLLGYAVSHIGFTGANLVYDSFLSEVTVPERMDKISGYGFAFGYIGGSTIPFLVSIGLITFRDSIGIDNATAVKISVAICAVWWGLFAIPFFRNVRQNYGVEKPKGQAVLRAAFASIGQTAMKIVKNKKILFFLLAYFFYIDGVGTVISMSTAYGATLGLDSVGMILALLVTQIVAFPCSIAFSHLTKRFGSLNLLRAAVCLYLGICVVGFLMGCGLEEGWFGIPTATALFFALAFMVGMVQGGIQAVSRSYFAKMIPPENSGEFFGFFDIFGKFASVLGPFLYAIVQNATGRSSFGILAIAALFLVGLTLLNTGRKHFV